MRKITSTAFVWLALGLFMPAFASAPYDVYEDHYAHPYYMELVEMGVLNEDEAAEPDLYATRAYTIGLLMETMYPGVAEEMLEEGTLPSSPFYDVTAETPYYEEILAAYSMGYIRGDTDWEGNPVGTFRPSDTLIRYELVTMIMNMLDIQDLGIQFSKFTDVESSQWFTEPTEAARLFDIVVGYTDAEGNPTWIFGGTDLTTRGQVVKMGVSSLVVLEPNQVEDFTMDELSNEDAATAHNDLVDLLDAFSGTMEMLYQAYLDFETPEEITELEVLYETAESHWQAIGNYYERIIFDETQEPFLDAYLEMRPTAEIFLNTFKGFVNDLKLDFDGTMVTDRFRNIESRGLTLMVKFNVLVVEINAQATEDDEEE